MSGFVGDLSPKQQASLDQVSRALGTLNAMDYNSSSSCTEYLMMHWHLSSMSLGRQSLSLLIRNFSKLLEEQKIRHADRSCWGRGVGHSAPISFQVACFVDISWCHMICFWDTSCKSRLSRRTLAILITLHDQCYVGVQFILRNVSSYFSFQHVSIWDEINLLQYAFAESMMTFSIVCPQFRGRVKDVLAPEHDDHELLRWLRGKRLTTAGRSPGQPNLMRWPSIMTFKRQWQEFWQKQISLWKPCSVFHQCRFSEGSHLILIKTYHSSWIHVLAIRCCLEQLAPELIMMTKDDWWVITCNSPEALSAALLWVVKGVEQNQSITHSQSFEYA